MTHPLHIERYPSSLGELADEIGDLRYDALASFLSDLSAKIGRDSVADNGRAKLAASLAAYAAHLGNAADDSGAAWRAAAPFMQAVYDPLATSVKVQNAKTGA